MGYMNSATLDHVVPASLGGDDEDWNLVMTCYRCNQERAHLCWMGFEYHARRFGPDARPVDEKQPVRIKQNIATLAELVRVEKDTLHDAVVRLLVRMLIHRLTRNDELLRYKYHFLREKLGQRNQHDTATERTDKP
jgi:hypothetical protein